MPIEFKGSRAVFREMVSVEEAEGLLEWLQKNPTAKLDLSTCDHLHPANLQVLMAANAVIARWPKNSDLRAWLQTALRSE
jgi:hypothetical protein